MIAERNHTGSGQGSEIDHIINTEIASIREAISQNQATFGIGIVYLNGFSIVHGQNIAQLVGVCGTHVFDSTDKTVNFDVRLGFSEGFEDTQYGCGAGHITAHGLHTCRSLEGEASSIKGHTFTCNRDFFTSFSVGLVV